jgi:FAD/FMN-containing dehydrogenase
MLTSRRQFIVAGTIAALGLSLVACTTDGSWVTVKASALEALRKKLKGQLLLPNDFGFTEGWIPTNGQFLDTVPIAVARIADAGDIIACLQWCKDEGLPFAVRAGGHSYAGLSTSTGLIIDIRELATLSVDDSAGTITTGGAATNGGMLDAVKNSPFILPGGTCLSVCLGGLALGGGIGYHTRWAGLTADHMLSTTVVTAAGDIVTASADENPDLFWAMRGGTGGTFGVNTEFTFSLAEVPTDSIYYRFTWTGGADDAVAMFRTTDELMQTAPNEFIASGYAQTIPIASGKSEKDALEIALRGQFNGTEDDFRSLVAPILATNPATVTITPQQFWDTAPIFTSEEAENHAWGDHSKYTDAAIPEDVLVELVDTLTQAPARDSINNAQLWMLGWFGGKETQGIARTDTAYVHRTAKNMVRPSPVWSDLKPELGQELREWTNEMISIASPHTLDESYQNFPNREIENWEQQYFAENIDRLIEVKTKWDPDNAFRSAQSIAPAT